MVDSHDGPPPDARPPQLADLLSLCRSLNRKSVRCVVVGGMAMIQAGFVCATEGIDLLVDTDRDNLGRLRAALLDLPDQAVREMGEPSAHRGPHYGFAGARSVRLRPRCESSKCRRKLMPSSTSSATERSLTLPRTRVSASGPMLTSSRVTK